jgi:hypothetical protein
VAVGFHVEQMLSAEVMSTNNIFFGQKNYDPLPIECVGVALHVWSYYPTVFPSTASSTFIVTPEQYYEM